MLPENKHRFLTMTALIGIMLVLLVGLPSHIVHAANCGGLPVSGGIIPPGTYTMTDNCNVTATLEVNSGTVTINGGGFTISGGGTMRVLEVSNAATLNLDNVTVANGHANIGGGIHNTQGSSLTITNSAFFNNRDSGIYNEGGVLIVTSSTFSGDNNTGIANGSGTATVNTSTFSGQGIGIANSDVLFVSGSIFSNNGGGMFGGGIMNLPSPVNIGTLTVTNSVFTGNSARASGGGISSSEGRLTVTNSIFSGNSAGREGGAISVDGPASITASCFENNVSGLGTDVHLFVGTLTAENNWWGVATGPNTPGADTTNVPVSSWLTSPDDPSCLPTEATTLTQPALNQLLDIDGVTAYDLPDGYYGRVLMRDGAWQANPGTIPQELIDNGVILAVDVFQLSGQQSDNDFGGHVPICLEGSGRLIFLDATTSPRVMVELETFSADGMTCGWVPNAGTLVLIQGG